MDRLPLPSPMIYRLVDRAISRRPPFRDKSDGGFRDALIWQSILDALAEKRIEPPLALVSGDRAAFGADGLREELRSDLEAIGVAPDQMSLHRSLADFVVDHFGSDPDLLARVSDLIRQESQAITFSLQVAASDHPVSLLGAYGTARIIDVLSMWLEVKSVIPSPDDDTALVVLDGAHATVVLDVEGYDPNERRDLSGTAIVTSQHLMYSATWRAGTTQLNDVTVTSDLAVDVADLTLLERPWPPSADE